MAMGTVRVVARITALPDRVDALKAVLLGLVGPTRQEPGCIEYQLLQNTAEPTDFTFVEHWQNDAAIDAHLASAAVQEALSKVRNLLAAEPDIRRYTTVA